MLVNFSAQSAEGNLQLAKRLLGHVLRTEAQVMLGPIEDEECARFGIYIQGETVEVQTIIEAMAQEGMQGWICREV